MGLGFDDRLGFSKSLVLKNTLFGRRQVGSRKRLGKAFSGNHQRSWLWGKHAVLETLSAGRWPVREVFATEEAAREASDRFDSLANRGVSVQIVGRERLEELSKSSEHQGLVARLGAYAYGTLDELLASLGQAGSQSRPLVVMCDRIQDSFNFGAILRCCDGAGVLAVVVGQRHQAAMTPHVIRSSSGAANHIPVIETDDLCAAAKRIAAGGATLIAADSNATQNLWQSDLKGFNLLILGSEAHGVAPELLALCDHRIAIPMAGHVDSLNVAVASGILLYEIRRQQQA